MLNIIWFGIIAALGLLARVWVNAYVEGGTKKIASLLYLLFAIVNVLMAIYTMYNWIRRNDAGLLYKMVIFVVVYLLLQMIIGIFIGIVFKSDKQEISIRETYDLDERDLNEDDKYLIRITKSKKDSTNGKTIIFINPLYYVTDINGRIWYERNGEKNCLGHTGKYDEISDYFVRAGYQTIRYELFRKSMKDRENISDICKVLSKVMDENGIEEPIVFCPGFSNEYIEEINNIISPCKIVSVGVINDNQLNLLNGISKNKPVFIGSFEVDPYSSIKEVTDDKIVTFSDTDFAICKNTKKKIKRSGYTEENGGETNYDVLDTILEWLASDCRIDV